MLNSHRLVFIQLSLLHELALVKGAGQVLAPEFTDGLDHLVELVNTHLWQRISSRRSALHGCAVWLKYQTKIRRCQIRARGAHNQVCAKLKGERREDVRTGLSQGTTSHQGHDINASKQRPCGVRLIDT
jgi:hypothetical protein